MMILVDTCFATLFQISLFQFNNVWGKSNKIIIFFSSLLCGPSHLFDWENTQTPSTSNKYLRLNVSNATEHRNSISISHVILSVLYSNNIHAIE